MTTRQSRHNARRRAEKLAAGECVEIGCPRKSAPDRIRCADHLAMQAAAVKRINTTRK